MATIVKKNWNELGIALPDFKDKGTFLKTCGTVIAQDIGRMIEAEVKPNGMPQKENKPGPYRELKKYLTGRTTPLRGFAPGSPYLQKESTWKRDLVDEHTLIVHANTLRAEVVRELAMKGYWIVGISKQAELAIAKRLYQYLMSKIRKMAAGKAV
jgi:hypothetical protein